MARSTKFSTDFNIREALKRNRQLLTGAQESGRTALAGYEELAPQYNTAVEQARNYQSVLTKNYESYRQDYNTAATSYNQDLQRRKSAYESVLAQGQGLESNFTSAAQTLGQLKASQQQAESEVNRLYKSYESEYTTAMATASESYESQLKNLQIVQDYQELIAFKQQQLQTAGSPTESQAITNYISWAESNLDNIIKSNNLEGQTLSGLQADTGYVTRYAQQQSAGSLQSYQNYLQNTYNPSVASYNQYASGTYNPAAQAYQDFMGSGQVQEALQSYESLAQDTGYVDRAASDTKAVYDASQQEYSRLQAAYEGMAPQLSEYSQQAETAKQQVLTLAGQAPGLQRSLAIDTEARKRGDRLGYRRSVLSRGYKRRGAAR